MVNLAASEHRAPVDSSAKSFTRSSEQSDFASRSLGNADVDEQRADRDRCAPSLVISRGVVRLSPHVEPRADAGPGVVRLSSAPVGSETAVLSPPSLGSSRAAASSPSRTRGLAAQPSAGMTALLQFKEQAMKASSRSTQHSGMSTPGCSVSTSGVRTPGLAAPGLATPRKATPVNSASGISAASFVASGAATPGTPQVHRGPYPTITAPASARSVTSAHAPCLAATPVFTTDARPPSRHTRHCNAASVTAPGRHHGSRAMVL